VLFQSCFLLLLQSLACYGMQTLHNDKPDAYDNLERRHCGESKSTDSPRDRDDLASAPLSWKAPCALHCEPRLMQHALQKNTHRHRSAGCQVGLIHLICPNYKYLVVISSTYACRCREPALVCHLECISNTQYLRLIVFPLRKHQVCRCDTTLCWLTEASEQVKTSAGQHDGS
jgi:hypothetical protein